jgi:hypothetical protein
MWTSDGVKAVMTAHFRRRMAMRLGLAALLGGLGFAAPAPAAASSDLIPGAAAAALRPCPGFGCGDNHNQVRLRDQPPPAAIRRNAS